MVSDGAKIGGTEMSVESSVAASEPKNRRRVEIDSTVRADRVFENIRYVYFTACYAFHCPPKTPFETVHQETVSKTAHESNQRKLTAVDRREWISVFARCRLGCYFRVRGGRFGSSQAVAADCHRRHERRDHLCILFVIRGLLKLRYTEGENMLGKGCAGILKG